MPLTGEAVRAFRRQPGLAGVAVVTFALGLALVTLQLSFVNGALLNRLPFPRADQLLRIDALQHGVDGRFYAQVRRYHHEDGKAYWTMDSSAESTGLINRCDEGQTCEARQAAGTLPSQ